MRIAFLILIFIGLEIALPFVLFFDIRKFRRRIGGSHGR